MRHFGTYPISIIAPVYQGHRHVMPMFLKNGHVFKIFAHVIRIWSFHARIFSFLNQYIVSLAPVVKTLRMVKRMVRLSMLRIEKGFLKVNFDINLDIVSKLMDSLMVIMSMRGKLLNLDLDTNLNNSHNKTT